MNLKNVLFDLLRPFGITNNYTGCSQLIRAVEIVLEKPDGIQAFLRPLSKLHGHYMELFSHLETGFDKYAVS